MYGFVCVFCVKGTRFCSNSKLINYDDFQTFLSAERDKISGCFFCGILIIFVQNPYSCLVIIELRLNLPFFSDDYVCDDDDYEGFSRMIW